MKRTLVNALAFGASLFALSAMAATTDGWLISQTKLSLWTTAGVSSTAVHVDANDGVITLYGKVPTSEQKAIAEKTARETPGVRDVKSLLQVVTGAQEKRFDRSDKEIQDTAQKRLSEDLALKDSKISVKSVDKGLVLLTGNARTFSDHLRAVVIVDRIPGVRRVASEVKGPDGYGNDERVTFLSQPSVGALAESKHAAARTSASDMRTSAAVKLRLLTTSEIPSTEISVDTDDGVVTLFGIVPTEGVKQEAAIQARKVHGVDQVQNQLEVVPSSRKQVVEAKDADISRDLVLAFKAHPEFKNVVSSVKNGTVHLTGIVGSGWDEVNAVRTARSVVGARGVEDQLKIDSKVGQETTRRD